MKKILMGSIVLMCFAIAIVLFEASCKKNAVAQNSTTIPLTKEQILVQKTWRVAQLHHVIGGAYSSYIYGGMNTTGINYDALRFTFNSDGTGTHINQNGTLFTTTWQFLSSDKRTLLLTLSNSSSNTWQMIQIADNYLNASSQLTISGNSNNVETMQLIQIP